jgi:hypothetical protein
LLAASFFGVVFFSSAGIIFPYFFLHFISCPPTT